MNAVDLTQAVSSAPAPRQAVGQVGGRGAEAGPAAVTGEVKNEPTGAQESGAPAPPKEEEGSGSEGRRAADTAIEQKVEEAKRLAGLFNRRLSFDLNHEVDRVVISVIEKDTGRVIRKIPPEEMLRVLRQLHEARGLILDAEG